MPHSPVTWVDGEQASTLPLPDRGLDFGDGLFETFLLCSGRPLFTDLHYARLARGLGVLGIDDCLPEVREQITVAAMHVLQASWPWAVLRLTLTRGSAPRGYAAPQKCTPRIVLAATQLQRDCSVMMPAAALVSSSITLSEQPALAGIKHLNRLEQVLAANEARDAGADEALMVTAGGEAVAVTAGNIFVLSQGCLLTPPIERCGIRGTRREKLMRDWAPALGLAVQERVLTPGDIAGADEFFYTNSLVGLRPVSQFADAKWSEYRVCEQLYAAYRDDAA